MDGWMRRETDIIMSVRPSPRLLPTISYEVQDLVQQWSVLVKPSCHQPNRNRVMSCLVISKLRKSPSLIDYV
jgi:hypothetical protein